MDCFGPQLAPSGVNWTPTFFQLGDDGRRRKTLRYTSRSDSVYLWFLATDDSPALSDT